MIYIFSIFHSGPFELASRKKLVNRVCSLSPDLLFDCYVSVSLHLDEVTLAVYIQEYIKISERSIQLVLREDHLHLVKEYHIDLKRARLC